MYMCQVKKRWAQEMYPQDTNNHSLKFLQFAVDCFYMHPRREKICDSHDSQSEHPTSLSFNYR